MLQKSRTVEENETASNDNSALNVLKNCKPVKLSREIATDDEKYRIASGNVSPSSSPSALCEELADMLDSNEANEMGLESENLPVRTVPLVMNRYVRDNIRYLQTRGRWYMKNWMHLSGEYMPMMKGIFEKEHIPSDLAYLSLQESGLDPKARSWASAVGLWQFVPSTGLRYGLKFNWWYDERRDPVLATEAAARLLKNLHDDLGDWYLAIAAYNCGELAVDWAIQRSGGSRDFWKIRRYLPWETRNYVPEYIAVTLIMTDPGKFGFDGDVRTAPIEYDTVTVPCGVELADISRVTGVPLDSLMTLNPMLTRNITPPDYHGEFRLNVPSGTDKLFAEDYSKFAVSEKPVWMYHTVRRGETLSGIAAQYGMSVHRLMVLNHLRGSFIRPGARLSVVYHFAGSYSRIAGQDPRPPGDYHRVIAGENLGEIASLYRVTVRDLEIWNGIHGSFIRAGQYLRVAPPQYAVKRRDRMYAEDPGARKLYKVKEGDSLWGIAREFGVSVANLRMWNGDPAELRPGQSIVIRN
jgi:membrane-bound lytic murein transglycosylase D